MIVTCLVERRIRIGACGSALESFYSQNYLVHECGRIRALGQSLGTGEDCAVSHDLPRLVGTPVWGKLQEL